MSEKRKLTPFLAHEMLFDFATGKLDADRKAAVENFIKDDSESQKILQAIREGLAYAQSLRSIELSDDVFLEFDQAENLVSLSRRLARWSEWPDSLRWSIIALTVSIFTASFVVVIPWKSIPLFHAGPSLDANSIEIARVETRRQSADDPNLVASTIDESKQEESGPLEGSGDEEFSDEASGANVAPPVAAIQRPAPPPMAPAAVVPPAPAVVAVPKPSDLPKPPPELASSNAAPKPPAASSKAARSFVYRAFMTLSDLENIAPKITQQMKELGAEKAGEVELGWRRGAGRYYHFTIPEINEPKLLESLRVYGPVRISKDPHPRVMPEGQVRFILWIESGT